ncbi:MAG: glycosyltransferase family 2 protein, partial [Burkholderiales bacterium]|nr:glycosyltransferase family 2 protein [Burkholderiales bacterium]
MVSITDRIAIVLPVFKHSSLVAEALSSVIGQTEFEKVELVIVDDGCPYYQTNMQCNPLAHIYSNVHYIRQANKGLSAARNTGIDFVLSNLPQCQAIYFLDADNRLLPFAVQQMQHMLRVNEGSDWFYPDINMFGLPWYGDYSGPFRPLTECLMNICEAGSLVRIHVFASNLRFDEKMRDGYEDWEFWISALSAGFRGMHFPASGFLYRKRAESMLSDSTRLHSKILDYIEKKHRWLKNPVTMVQMEHIDTARYATIKSVNGTVELASDPSCGEHYDINTYTELLLNSFYKPNWYNCGFIIIFMSEEVKQVLTSHGLLNFTYWTIERRLTTANFACVSLKETNRKELFFGDSAVSEGNNI